MERHEDLKGVVDRLEPGMKLFVQGAGEKSEGLSHGDHRTADGHAGVFFLRGEVESCPDGGEGLAGASLSIAGDERDARIEEGVEEAELAEIGRFQLNAPGHLQALGNFESLELSAADMTRWHELLLGGGEEYIFVNLQRAGAGSLDEDALGAAKALEFMGLHSNRANLELLGILGLDLVIEIILAGDAKGHRL